MQSNFNVMTVSATLIQEYVLLAKIFSFLEVFPQEDITNAHTCVINSTIEFGLPPPLCPRGKSL